MTFNNNAIFWVEVEKIAPNPYQPRRSFDEEKLRDLADSIRQYGVLQPLVVTQREIHRDDGGMSVAYELIAGERRLRASKIAGLSLVPVVIRDDHENERVKLELAIIENLQREDISPLERARAFHQLADKFSLKHGEIAQKVGKSREYVSNTIRLLNLPEEMLQALAEGKITEGHTRPLLMLIDRPEEQQTLFKEIVFKRINVRDAEQISRRIATDRVRKHDRAYNADIMELETKASEMLGTRVRVEPREIGGKVLIDFMSEEDLRKILQILNREAEILETNTNITLPSEVPVENTVEVQLNSEGSFQESPSQNQPSVIEETPIPSIDQPNPDDDLYTVTNFTV